MRDLPEGLRTALDGGASTLCWCWRITCADGFVLGLTEHDQDLTVDGEVYYAGSVDLSGAPDAQSDLSADTSAIAGVLSSDLITDDDLSEGRYDAALVDVLRVDWSDASQFVRVWRGRVGEIRQGETGFEAELKGLTSDLERTIGRVIQRRCDATVGDARCGVALASAAFQGTGVVTSLVTAEQYLASGLDGFAENWFVDGVLTWQTGANAGRRARVTSNALSGSVAVINLEDAPGWPVAVGDAFSVTAGCDKRWATCQGKFGNTVNFRGFPMMPGDDWVLAGPNEGGRNDGSSLWTDRED